MRLPKKKWDVGIIVKEIKAPMFQSSWNCMCHGKNVFHPCFLDILLDVPVKLGIPLVISSDYLFPSSRRYTKRGSFFIIASSNGYELFDLLWCRILVKTWVFQAPCGIFLQRGIVKLKEKKKFIGTQVGSTMKNYRILL